MQLTDDQVMMRDVAEKFARNELFPVANEIDLTENTPEWVTKRCAELGFFSIFIPEEYGGIDAGLTTACLILEEIAKASPAYAGVLSVEMILCPGAVNLIASEKQKQRLLPLTASGERVMAWSQSEPSGVANRNAHTTRLAADGNGYRLNGLKLFCTQGEAKTYLVMCRTRRDEKNGYGCVIVEREAEGFEVHKYEEKLGWRGTNTGTVAFTDIALTQDDIMGNLLTANADLAPINQASYIGHAATSLGCLEGMFEQTLAYIKERELYGEPMWKLSPISDRIGQIAAKIEACRALVYSASAQYDLGKMPTAMGSACKAFVCDTAFECTSQLLQMWGGHGMMHATGVDRYMRDARTKMVAEGSTEMHHAILAAKNGLPVFDRTIR